MLIRLGVMAPLTLDIGALVCFLHIQLSIHIHSGVWVLGKVPRIGFAWGVLTDPRFLIESQVALDIKLLWFCIALWDGIM